MMDMHRINIRDCGKISYMQIQNVTDAVQAIIDYYLYN